MGGGGVTNELKTEDITSIDFLASPRTEKE